MRLGGRLSAAIEVLDEFETADRPVSDLLKDWGVSHRFAGSGDRAAIATIVYDALRLKSSHAWRMDSDKPDALGFAVLLRQWSFTPEEIAAELENDRYAPALPSEAAFADFAARDLAAAPLHVQADIPQWLQPSFERAFGENWIEEAVALNTRAPLDLRVNRLKADRTMVLERIGHRGARKTPVARDGVRIDPVSGPARHPNLTSEEIYARGWFEVQDEGSQIVADLVAPQQNDQLLDLCAGAGGKTLALSAAMNNKGQIHAYDSDRRRLAPIVERLKRAGTRNVQRHEQAETLVPLEGRMDRVLVDAPCTGTGTWRRRPDTKWRLSETALHERMTEQDAVLSQAVRFVRPGGMLFYVTCSLLPEENADRIAALRAARPDFDPAPLEETWRHLFEAPLPRHRAADGSTFSLTPAADGTDGFFIAALQRKP